VLGGLSLTLSSVFYQLETPMEIRKRRPAQLPQEAEVEEASRHQPRVGTLERFLAILGDVLDNDKDDVCRMRSVEPASDLLAVENGRALYQLKYKRLRYPMDDTWNLRENMARGSIRASLIDAVETAARHMPGEWRVVALTFYDQGWRNRFTRQASGMSQEEVERHFAGADPTTKKTMQLTQAVEVKDPVLYLDLALAEMTQAIPVNSPAFRYPEKSMRQAHSSYDQFVESQGLMRHLPFAARQQRIEASRIICEHYDIEEATGPAPERITDEVRTRVRQFTTMGLSASETAKLLDLGLADIADILTTPEEDGG